MKKILCLLLSVFFLFQSTPLSASEIEPDIETTSAILIEAETGQIIYEKNFFKLVEKTKLR